ncbi:helix-turn-helix transcriptional regulator [Tateyamaria omphalii]|uniref:AraC family transcriptional regulator n=1 Tax=Tateyamaria omphalii TaxID=299262 RepID=UPI001C995242|nr:AraC family transcriptional regulator [Tateyamaria omphalii]MBY5933977.1 helix-turn-helix transcriptional regulator [Tateyamaria omphalii]
MAAAQETYYKIARTTLQLCGLLHVDPANVMRRMRFPPDFLENEGRGVNAADYFAGWNAILAEASRDDTPLFLGQAYARGPFNPAFFAFTCSPSVAVGLERLSLFKPITGPLSLGLKRTSTQALEITKTSNVPSLPLPSTFGATELVFLTEAVRGCTGRHVVPDAAQLPERLPCHDGLEEFLEVRIETGACTSLTFSPEDADRKLLSADPAQWAQLEPGFKRQMRLQIEEQAMAARLRATLAEMLPAGEATVDAAARRMRLSTRSLQRHLKDEGTRFQTVLDSTRADLAREYLTSTDLNVAEISYLLAYRDPNSFYRAFGTWTGQTPQAVREGAAPMPAR